MTANGHPHVGDVEYVPESDSYRASFDPGNVAANAAVVETVATVFHCDPLDLDPLYRSVDTDSLDSLVRSGPAKASPYLSVSFRYADADVTVRANGTVVVAPDDVDR